MRPVLEILFARYKSPCSSISHGRNMILNVLYSLKLSLFRGATELFVTGHLGPWTKCCPFAFLFSKPRWFFSFYFLCFLDWDVRVNLLPINNNCGYVTRSTNNSFGPSTVFFHWQEILPSTAMLHFVSPIWTNVMYWSSFSTLSITHWF